MKPRRIDARSFLLAGALLPPLFVLQHWGPSGVPIAEGCSGAGPVAVPASVTLNDGSNPSPGSAVGVDSDGLIVLSVRGPAVTATSSGLDLVVTNQEGTQISGEQRILLANLQSGTAVGWKADQQLALGTKLHLVATFVGAPTPALEADLEVKAEATPLPTGGLNLESWVNVGHGVGEWITCEAGDVPAGLGSKCGTSVVPGSTISLPSSEQILRAVNTSWTRMSPDTFVAWQAHVELADAPHEDSALAPHFFLGKSAPALPPEEMGRLLFPAESQSYCAVLVVRDLWSGEKVETQVCGEPPRDVPTTRDYPIDVCAQPPNEELTWAWCQPQAHWSDPACAQFVNGGGGPPMMPTAGSAGSLPSGSGDTGTGVGQGGRSGGGGLGPGRSLGGSNSNSGLAPNESSRTSSGCHFGLRKPTTSGLRAFVTATLLLTWLGRRQRR